jgi:hypothetical protein
LQGPEILINQLENQNEDNLIALAREEKNNEPANAEYY